MQLVLTTGQFVLFATFILMCSVMRLMATWFGSSLHTIDMSAGLATCACTN
jgi:hypothetical protein